MKSWKKPTKQIVEEALSSTKREIERNYFFARLANPHWVKVLEARGYFKNPPGLIDVGEGRVQCPPWPELSYLTKMANEVPKDVVRIVKSLPKTENPQVYHEILAMALAINDVSKSAQLLNKLIESVESPRIFSHNQFGKLLAHWSSGGRTGVLAALHLARHLIRFYPDPKREEKARRRKENPKDWSTIQEPYLKFDDWTYKEIFNDGISPLADIAPLETAEILIATVAEMNQFKWDESRDEGSESKYADYSEIWCKRIDVQSRDFLDKKEVLVHALTQTCEKVFKQFEQNPRCIKKLNSLLCDAKWSVFDRVRHYCYARHLNATKAWIKSEILEHKDYSEYEYGIEFAEMVRNSCDTFGAQLLPKGEFEKIFDAILNGPSKERLKQFWGDNFTEDGYTQRRDYFHKKQLWPFETVLFGKYKERFASLASKDQKGLSLESYKPHRDEGVKTGVSRSPVQGADLAKKSDAELISFLNEWQDVHRDAEQWWVDISFDGLAIAFQNLIEQNPARFPQWGDNWKQLKRPIYLRYALNIAVKQVKAGNLDGLTQWFELCDWIVTHQDQEGKTYKELQEASVDNPSWDSARRAVTEFVNACLSDEVKLPITWRQRILGLLKNLCCGYDLWLDRDEAVTTPRDYLTDAINTTRGQALERLFDYAWWVRKHGNPAEATFAGMPEVPEILDARLNGVRPLRNPEYALLGSQLPRIYGLDKEWLKRNIGKIFPRGETMIESWKAAFDSLLSYTHAYGVLYEILEPDFQFAVKNIGFLSREEKRHRDVVHSLGEHLFFYYIWGKIQLAETDSLFLKYYKATSPKDWGSIFDFAGRALNSSPTIEDSIRERCLAFVDHRIAKKCPDELRGFAFWLKAETLDANWRLEKLSAILEITKGEVSPSSIVVETLSKLLTLNTAKVVECFAKLTGAENRREYFYVDKDKATPILLAGLKSLDATVVKNAKTAQANLLKSGHLEYLEM